MNSRLERAFHMQNMNNEQSQNFYNQLIDANSRSRLNNFLREESMNIRVCFTNDYQKQVEAEEFGQFNVGNAINFLQASRQNMFNNWNCNKQHWSAQKNKLENELADVNLNKRKGLKFLAWIIARLLRRKRYQYNEIVDECINYVLGEQGENENYGKEAQNVRRRIYDAINVMTAIGLVIKNSRAEIYITQPDLVNFIYQDKIMNMLLKEHKEIVTHEDGIENYKKIIDKKLESIMIKKRFLTNIKQRISALKTLIARNAEKGQTIDVQKDMESQQRIHFPFIMIGTLQQEIAIICHGKQRKQVKINHKRNQILILSELDGLCQLYPDSLKKPKIAHKKVKRQREQGGKLQSELQQIDYFQVLHQAPEQKFEIKQEKIQKYSNLYEKGKIKEEEKKERNLAIRQGNNGKPMHQQSLFFFNQNSRSSFQRYTGSFEKQMQDQEQKHKSKLKKQTNFYTYNPK